MSDRIIVAKELAAKDGQDWEKLDKVMHNAYLHNADGAIAERKQVAEGKEPGAPVIYVCDVCKDEAYIGNKPCYDCNPRGLTKEEVHPTKQRLEDNKEVAEEEEAVILPAETLNKAVDQVVEKIKALTPKPGQYLCTKCVKLHRESSRIGKKHLKNKAG